MTPLAWTPADTRAVDTARVLAADTVEKVGNGHPGTAISLAPAAYLLYQKVMTGDPADPKWLGRDRFVLSAGHSSLTQYCQDWRELVGDTGAIVSIDHFGASAAGSRLFAEYGFTAENVAEVAAKAVAARA